jgi:tetratricopeptide (TPR) repeat protein
MDNYSVYQEVKERFGDFAKTTAAQDRHEIEKGEKLLLEIRALGRYVIDIDVREDIAQMARDLGTKLFDLTGRYLPVRLEPLQISTSFSDPVPFQAPPDLSIFVGREEEIRAIQQYVEKARPCVVTITGMGGIGKTSLAVHLAHRLRTQFKDGVLWARIDVSDPMTILNSFARSYGMDLTYLQDQSSRASALRSLLSKKETLVILDNAETLEQIEFFIPGTGQSVVIVTTRLKDLTPLANSFQMQLEAFSSVEAVTLLGRLIGGGRVEREQESTEMLLQTLGYLPLAINLAASMLTTVPLLSIQEYLELIMQGELTDFEDKMDAVINISYQNLQPPFQSLFTQLAVFPGATFSVEAASAIREQPIPLVKIGLGELVKNSLLQSASYDRFLIHPLLRQFAQDHLQPEDASVAQRKAAQFFQNLVIENSPPVSLENFQTLDADWDNILGYLHWAEAAENLSIYIEYATCLVGQNLKGILPVRGLPITKKIVEKALTASVELGNAETEAFFRLQLGHLHLNDTSYETAEAEIVKSLELAQTVGNEIAEAYAMLCLAQLERERANYEFAIHNLEASHKKFSQRNDKRGVVATLFELGFINVNEGKFEEAARYFQEALAILESTPDISEEAKLYHELGRIAARQGKYDEAEKYLRDSLEINESLGYQRWVARTLHQLGMLAMHKGQIDAAQSYYEKSLEINELLGDEKGIAIIAQALGGIAYRQGNLQKAESFFKRSLNINEEIGDERGLATNYKNLGDIYNAQKDLPKSLIWYQKALETNEATDNKYGIAIVAKAMGDVALQSGQYDIANHYYQKSLTLNKEMDSRSGEAYVLNGLGELAERQGNLESAIDCWQRSFALFEELGSHMTEKLKSRLDKYSG